MKRVLALVVIAACGKSSNKAPAAAPPAAAHIQQVKAWADRACACNADRDCVKPIREEWEAAKYGLRDAADKFAPADRTAYDTELTRFRQCGDAAGVTIWLP